MANLLRNWSYNINQGFNLTAEFQNRSTAESNFSIPYFHYHIGAGILIILLGIGGVLISFGSLIFLIVYSNHRLIKATCIFVSITLTVGTLIGNIPLFLVGIAYPSKIVCTSIPLLHGFSFSLIYSSLLVKVIRLLRVWRASLKNEKRIWMTSNNSVIFQTIGIVFIQVIQFLILIARYYVSLICKPEPESVKQIDMHTLPVIYAEFSVDGVAKSFGVRILRGGIKFFLMCKALKYRVIYQNMR